MKSCILYKPELDRLRKGLPIYYKISYSYDGNDDWLYEVFVKEGKNKRYVFGSKNPLEVIEFFEGFKVGYEYKK